MHASKMKILLVLLFISINFGIVFLQNDVIKDTNDNNHSTDNKWLNVCGEQSFSTCRCPVINQYNYMRRNSNTTGNDREHVSLLSNTCHQLGLPTDECSSRDIQQYANTFCVNDTTTKSYTDLDGIVEAACERFGISDLHCSCPQLYHSSNRAHECNDTSEFEIQSTQSPSLSNSKSKGRFNNLQAICQFYGVNATLCQCPGVSKINPKFIAVCRFVSRGKYKKQEFKCKVHPYTRGRKIFIVIASIFGIIGNSFVILIRSQQWKNSIHYRLISGLAFSDLTFSILQIVFHAPAIGNCKWSYGLTMCKLYALLGINYSIDLGFAVIISIERYIAIVHPLSNSFEKRNVFVFVLINVLYSIFGVVPAIIVLEISKEGLCKENWDGFPLTSRGYTWIIMIFYFVVPVLIIAVLYNKSMCALQKSIMRRLSAIHTASKMKLLVENRRILIVMNTIVVTLVLLVSPYHVYWMIFEYVGIQRLGGRTLAVLQLVALLPYSLTVMVNPIIYSLIDRHFRANAKYLLLHLKHRRHSYSSSSTTLHTLVPPPERPAQPPLLSRRKSSV